MKKMMCEELSPIDQAPYGEPYEFYSIVGEIEKWSLHKMFRQEMRSLMSQIGLKLMPDATLDEIVSLAER